MAWGLARSQSDGGLPPPPTRPPDMQANICAQTSQDGEKEFHSCAHLRLGRLALTPSPPRGMDAGGARCPPGAPHPSPASTGGSGASSRMEHGGSGGHRRGECGRVGDGSGHAHGSADARGRHCLVCPGPPLLGTPCAVPGRARGHGEMGGICASPPLVLCYPIPGPFAAPPAPTSVGAERRARGCLPTDVYWQFANVKRGPRGLSCLGWGGHGACPHAECCLPRPPVPPAPSPLRPRPFPPGPGASWALSKRGLFAQAGISRSLCSFDFLLP